MFIGNHFNKYDEHYDAMEMTHKIYLCVINKPTRMQLDLLKQYFLQLPMNEIIIGLKFAHNRWIANDAGTLKVGRKSIVRKETHSITIEQAQWRLKNWDVMIKNYQELGYSNTTIHRIKKTLNMICTL